MRDSSTRPITPAGVSRAAQGATEFPAPLIELKEQYPDEEIGPADSGTFYVGDKGIIFTETYGGQHAHSAAGKNE